MARPKTKVQDIPEPDKAPGCAHPKDVFDLIGHQQAEINLANLINANSLHHAWLISGPKGVGKATLAYRMIRRVLAGQAQSENRLDVPAQDPVAQRISSLGHADFLLIRRPYDEKTKKSKSEIPVGEVRKIPQFFSKKPAEGGWRVCLVDSADEMNRNATNALLKTLEEPPDKSLIILISKTPGRLLPTIRSRCKLLQLTGVESQDLQSWLESKTNVDQEDMQNVLALAGGIPGLALSLVQHIDTVLRPLLKYLESFPRPDLSLAHRISDSLAPVGAQESYELFWEILDKTITAQAVYAATGDWSLPNAPLALQHPVTYWLNLQQDIQSTQMAQTALNMNKKTVLLDTLLRLGG